MAQWAADGLLAIFFFVAGLELKREFVAGDLRDPRRAALPVAAAVGGMAVPALIYVAVNAPPGADALAGWAIPTATDIAFALAVLAVISTHLPAALRTFLLTLAVVDDLLAITIIAVFYTSSLQLLPLLLALVPLGLFALLVQRRVRSWWLLLPLAAITWVLVHESGRARHRRRGAARVHRAGDPPRPRARGRVWPSTSSTGSGRCRPGSRCRCSRSSPPGCRSAGAAVSGPASADSVTLGIVVGLVAGKTVGVLGSTWLVQRFTRARLADGLSWWDVLGLALLAGIGFTVSLLIGELAFGAGSERDDHVKIGVLLGSLLVGAARDRRAARPQPALPPDLRGGGTRHRRRRRARRLPVRAARRNRIGAVSRRRLGQGLPAGPGWVAREQSPGSRLPGSRLPGPFRVLPRRPLRAIDSRSTARAPRIAMPL